MSSTPVRRRHSENFFRDRFVNDDGSETQSRRNSIAVSMRRKSLSATFLKRRDRINLEPLTPGQKSAPLEIVTPVPKLTVEEKAVNFELWLKMATDNKITATNSWKLALIDYFHEMTLFIDVNSINFQQVSCTLDGCVKVYISRVDFVVIEVRKLASGLIDSFKRGDEDNDGNEDANSESRARKKNSKQEPILVKDYVSLTKKLELEFSIDPLFKKISAEFDEGCSLVDNLPVDRDGRIVFDSSDTIPDEDNDENDIMAVEEPNFDFSKLRSMFLPELQQIFNKEICPSCRNVDFLGNNILEHANAYIEGDNYPDLFADGNYNNNDDVDANFDANFDASANFDVSFDANANFDDDYTMNDNVNNNVSGVFDEDDIDSHAHSELTEKDCVMAMMSNENELFSYFDSAFLRNWAGPEHWKLKKVNEKQEQQEPKETGEEVKEKKKKKTVSINFSEDLDEEQMFSTDRGIINAKVAEIVSHGYQLTDDVHFSSKRLFKSFVNPEFMLLSKRQYEEQLRYYNDDDANNANNANNADDSDDSDDSDDADDSDDSDDADKADKADDADDADDDDADNADVDETFWADQNNDPAGTSFPDMTTYTGDAGRDVLHNDDDEGEFINNLVAQEKSNRPEFIKYAKTAKRVDVKKLKENIWKTLIDNYQEEERRLSLTSSDHVIEQKFTGAVKNLKKIYTPGKMKDISLSFCFICLLHLANEKNLSISSSNDKLSELSIVHNAN